MGEMAQAAEQYREATRLDPDHADAWQSLGMALVKLEKLEEAIAALEKLVRLKPKDQLAYSSLSQSRYEGAKELWDKAEKAVKEAAKKLGVKTSEEPGEAAFYGPKIDFVVKDVIGREWQLGTVQVDYNLPERFGLTYTGADNAKHRPVMIHRAPFGSLERFTGVLIEHFRGAFPVWLAPEQARFLPVNEQMIAYAEKLAAEFKAAGLRVSVDVKGDKLGAQIRRGQLEKVPFLLVCGNREAEAGQVAVRSREKGDEGAQGADEVKDRIVELARTRR